MERVLRLRDGEAVAVSDGAGSYRPCRARRGAGRRLCLEPAGPVGFQPRSEPAVTVAFSLLKGERTEWAVEKLTEAGVDEILLLVCERTVVRPSEDRSERRWRRLEKVARQAAMQSRRLYLPRLARPVEVEEAISRAAGRGFIAEPGGGPPRLDRPFALVGPEGGWSSAELARAGRHGLEPLSLGAGVLRAETAAVAAGLLLTALRSGLVAASTDDRSR